ncbi:hypothetical protein MPSEU_000915700 [Mayamaea pseudoterrestris]|nr:hypothetical protein MPSEU_000915700 [Mayamaea pseudoterrestris]
MLLLTLLLLLALQSGDAFSIISSRSRRSTAIYEIIRAEETDFVVDPLEGGVLLAHSSYLELSGTVKHKPGEAQASLKSLTRYFKVTPVSDVGDVKIIAKGFGKENYVDPGETLQKAIYYGPMEAVKDALNSAGSAMDYEQIQINFLGGNLILNEVLKAAEHMVLTLDVKTKAKVTFSSVSHDDFPEDIVTATVIGIPSEQPALDDWSGAKKSVARGKLFVDKDGKSWTVTEEDINPAVA